MKRLLVLSALALSACAPTQSQSQKVNPAELPAFLQPTTVWTLHLSATDTNPALQRTSVVGRDAERESDGISIFVPFVDSGLNNLAHFFMYAKPGKQEILTAVYVRETAGKENFTFCMVPEPSKVAGNKYNGIQFNQFNASPTEADFALLETYAETGVLPKGASSCQLELNSK